jgi:hypothetical protein
MTRRLTMASILNFKTLHAKQEGFVQDIQSFLLPYVAKDDIEVDIIIKSTNNERQNKRIAQQMLEQEVKGSAVSVWKQGDYEFRFTENTFFWKGLRVYITASEKLFLYRWITRNKIAQEQLYYLSNLRKRLGVEFLRDTEDGAWEEGAK